MEGSQEKPKSLEDLEEQFGRGEIKLDEFQYAKRSLKTQELQEKLKHGEISREEFLRAQLQAGLEKLVVHGDYLFQEDGSVELRLRPDLDAMAGIYLMDLAGINYSAIEFQHKGKWVPGAVHIDTGERKEFTIEDDGSVFFDHHEKEKGEPTSATAIVYKKLINTKRPDGKPYLERQEWLDRFTAFVTEIDNLSYPLDERFFRGSWSNTLYGVQKVLPVSTIAEFFKKGKDPREPFTMEEAAKTTVKVQEKKEPLEDKTLLDVCNKTSQKVKMSIANIEKAVEKMKERGIKQEIPSLGKVVFQDVEKGRKNKIPRGFTAVKALGYDTYVLWSEDHKSFFISSQNKNIAEIYERIRTEIPAAKLIRGTMILRPPTAEGDKDLTLEKFLSILGLKEYTESAVEAATKLSMVKQETGVEKGVEVKDPLSAYIKDVLEVRFGEGNLDLEEFAKKRTAVERLVQEEKKREALDEAFGEGTFTLEEYKELKKLLKKQEPEERISKIESAGTEKSEIALLRERIEKEVETIKNLFPDLSEGAREEIAEKAREALRELAPEVIKESDPKILIPKIIGVLFDRIAELPEEALPGLREFKKNNPEGFARLKEELAEAFQETDKTKRKEKFDAVWKKFELAEEAEKLTASVKDLFETTSEICHLVRTKELSPEEKKEVDAALKKAREGQAALAEGFKKAAKGLGFIGAILFLVFLASFILVLNAAEYFSKRIKK